MKKKILCTGLLCLLILALAGCQCNKREQDTENKAEIKERISESKKELDEGPQEPATDEVKIRLYTVDDNGTTVSSKEIKILKLDSQLIWKELIKANIIDEQCQLLEFEDCVTASGQLRLNVNHEFGDKLRSMGTLGEEQIMACVVNTYLDAYKCEALMITEESNVLKTGHVVYDYDLGKMTVEE